MYYTIYKTTNILNGKFYIGTHKTKNINDSYLGSGKILKRAIEKHGIENFKKEILFVFDNPEDMFKKEAEIVNHDFLVEENTYNLKVGGFGGWDYINQNGISTGVKIINEKGLNNKSGQCFILKEKMKDANFSKTVREKISAGLKKYYQTHENTFKGKKHTELTKSKIGKTNSDKQKGKNNSQYGTCWMNDGKNNIKVNNKNVDMYKQKGYYIGRVMKNSVR